MNISSKISPSDYSEYNRIIKWFITIRWIACASVLTAIIVAYYVVHLRIPANKLFFINGMLFVLNCCYAFYFSIFKRSVLSRKEMSVFFVIQVICDYGVLFSLVYFTGFIENPFLYYFIFHLTLSSFIFSPAVVFMYVLLLITFFLAAIAGEYYGILPHVTFDILNGLPYYKIALVKLFGLGSTLLIFAYLITNFEIRLEKKEIEIKNELDLYRELDKIKSNFILQVTHELRGPIAALMGYLEMIVKGITGDVNKKTKEAVGKANHRAENLLMIIDEMLDYAHLKSSEEVSIGFTEIDMKDVIDDNMELVSYMAKHKNIGIISKCQPNINILANRDLLNIVFSNLFSNSLKYSPEGTKIKVRVAPAYNNVHIIIEDQGIGIDPSEKEKVFEEFYRTRQAREIERDGTGLGLSIVKKAVARMNGTLNLYSEVEKGTVFNIYLPRIQPWLDRDGGSDDG